LEVSPEEQKKRFQSRIDDPSKNWKLSPMDLESRRRWYDYSKARDAMMDATDTEHAPWNIVNNTDKRRGRLNCITHLLDQIPYEKPEPVEVELPRRSQDNAYDDHATMKQRAYVPEVF
jgi:polyphosphate kinase 2 (PPK2 family)